MDIDLNTANLTEAMTDSLNSEELDMTEHHYFASSVSDWRANKDIRELVREMDNLREGTAHGEYKIYRVPLPVDAPYDIRNYQPLVEGVEEL